ncbi:prolyl-tRNA synthetase [Roseimicrobium gellanilyticum]|uniref:Proline--tRNA ligase n=1 Tax=Roseimicrobium gellanilyticum TaxID=748857 RepID=A0A366HN62_9BACT|nr:proline--tRNA ligase [Roseimicrobium gellanilyticum]RBP43762.1 prolyl-tRNA synthetase [Roseimicrobium gellanilyticum]
MSSATAITPTRADDFPEWYQQVVRAADLAENSEVRGCMVIKPWGFGLWENIQRQLDAKFKATGHVNAYFPLLIPLSYLEKEAEHAEGFATECAVVTHHRLEAQKQEDGSTKMVPTGELAEPFVIRPTSETIIGAAFARWVESYRDLPLLINQWCNVMRWEMRPRLFLRTAEFLWQEGHTAHETEQEAMEEAKLMHGVYEEFLTTHLAIPVIPGEKSARERFPGAVNTFTVEAMVQDRKAIQAGTSHFLGQNFAKAANIEFLGRDNIRHLAWTTSWGMSTRLIGTLIMTHGDDDGIILPPRIAPTQIVILPVTPKPETRDAVIDACEALAKTLRSQTYHNEPLRVHVDKRDIPGGQRNWEWIKKGVPIRLEFGPRDIEKRSVAVSRRDKTPKGKEFIPKEQFIRDVEEILDSIQTTLLQRATALRDANTKKLETEAEFREYFKEDAPGGFALMHWAGSSEEEERIAKEMKVTIRCIPKGDQYAEEGTCFLTGRPSNRRVVFARSY